MLLNLVVCNNMPIVAGLITVEEQLITQPMKKTMIVKKTTMKNDLDLFMIIFFTYDEDLILKIPIPPTQRNENKKKS